MSLLSDGVVAQNDLRRLLYEIDVALLTRIQEAHQADHRNVESLWSYIGRRDENDITSVLHHIQETLDRISNPNLFRPSTSKSPTIVGRLWFEANKNSPDKLPTVARALANALCANRPDRACDMVSLMAVLRSPNQSDYGPWHSMVVFADCHATERLSIGDKRLHMLTSIPSFPVLVTSSDVPGFAPIPQ